LKSQTRSESDMQNTSCSKPFIKYGKSIQKSNLEELLRDLYLYGGWLGQTVGNFQGW